MLLDAKPGDIVDHINRNKLDNRRCNLRLATTQQNAWNRSKHSGLTYSDYLGVAKRYLDKDSWVASISIDGTNYPLGVFETQEEAAYVRDQFAMQLHGEYGVLNFEY